MITRWGFCFVVWLCGLSLIPSLALADARCAGGLFPPSALMAQGAESPPARWGSGPHTVVTWNFVEAADTTSGEAGIVVEPVIDGQNTFPLQARALVREAFAEWSRVMDIRFVELTDGTAGQLRIGAHAFNAPTLGHGFFPGQSAIAGDVHLANNQEWTDRRFLVTATHEIGHALGFMHIRPQADLAEVIMYAVFGPQAERLTRYDIAYAQSIYGPPIPTIERVEARPNNLLRVHWTYPTEPASDNTPTRRHQGDISPAVDDVVVEVNDGSDLQALRNYELQTTRLQLQTLSDGAEDNETRLFDETTQDGVASPTDTLWVRDGFRVLTGARAYRIEPDNLSFLGDYPLPQLVTVEATATSELRFQRAYVFSASQEIRYLLRVGDNEPQRLMVENGSNIFSEANSPYTLRTFDLSPFAGQRVAVIFEYHHDVSFDIEDNGVSIDDIELVDVLAESGAPTTHSNTITALATFFDLPLLPPGEHNVRIRTIFNGVGDAFFSEPRRATATALVGDVNGDNAVTPVDVVRAFQHALGVSPLLGMEEQLRANVREPQQTGVTSGDAQCILGFFLGLSSCSN